jgi:hypothetical protein
MRKSIISNTTNKTVTVYKKQFIKKNKTVTVNNNTSSSINTNSNVLSNISYKQLYAIVQYIKNTNVQLYNSIVNKQIVVNANLYKHYNISTQQFNYLMQAFSCVQLNVHNKYACCTSCLNVLNKHYKAQINTLHNNNVFNKLYNAM